MSLRPRVYQVHTVDSDNSPDDLASALCELQAWTGGLPLQSQDTAHEQDSGPSGSHSKAVVATASTHC
jgi:hypothetical protein